MIYVESKEVAKASISQLDPNNSVNALRSKYKTLPRQRQPLLDVDDSKCYFSLRKDRTREIPSTPYAEHRVQGIQAQVQQLWQDESLKNCL